MGLKRSSIAKAVESAFAVLGDIPEPATLIRSTSTYNTTTGSNSISTTNHVLKKAVFTGFKTAETDGIKVKASDVKMIIQQKELSIRPNMSTDNVSRTKSGISHSILAVSEDPAEVIYILQLRAV